MFEQLTIDGAIMAVQPVDRQECAAQLFDVYRSLCKMTIPEFYIQETWKSSSDRTKAKRLREKIISDGYMLMSYLEGGMRDESLLKDDIWQQKVIVFWNHYSLSVQNLNDFIQGSKVTIPSHSRDGQA